MLNAILPISQTSFSYLIVIFIILVSILISLLMHTIKKMNKINQIYDICLEINEKTNTIKKDIDEKINTILV